MLRSRPGLARVAALGLLAAALACKRSSPPPSPPPPMTITPITPSPLPPLPDPLPAVIATVNGRPIPLTYARIIVEQGFKGMIPTPDQNASAYRRAMEQLIARELVYQEAVRQNIRPDAKAVERVRRAVRSAHKGDLAW
jgi:hypothetical protein